MSAYQRGKFKQTYVNYARKGRPPFKKNTWRSAKYPQSPCFNETRVYLNTPYTLVAVLLHAGCLWNSTKDRPLYQSDQRLTHAQADLPVCVAPVGSTCKLNMWRFVEVLACSTVRFYNPDQLKTSLHWLELDASSNFTAQTQKHTQID
jgi:hypothetical protein